ncbi:hypothetical protein SS1G_00837 [Sclerotinia sclerotiorum 1980 UF-70]|uniref:Uncharacterized protein n=1 Tax=Sclerotinia sclerotiorum (strain ATCC 18683 / 1980 / Ss-1) TaxID=665079 RepID=A7E6B2_SCLS1|nr:hypothetical protein SS1G_00837 [Sclerotinia sclerotiorum 1980 UF-70]EDN91434.1 hypothetical protein SS1G_00837 [Sclerotinia sclerotiorum 1980 UF-70]
MSFGCCFNEEKLFIKDIRAESGYHSILSCKSAISHSTKRLTSRRFKIFKAFFCVLYTVFLLWNTKEVSSRAVHLNSTLMSTCRHAGIFNGQNTYYELGDCPFDLWLLQEQLHMY